MKYFVAILLFMAFLSCGKNHKEQKAIVEKMVGKEFIVPEDFEAQILDTEYGFDFNNADFKIVTYIDSTGCTSCNMKLESWTVLLNEIKSLEDNEVNFLMVINSKDTKGIQRLLKTGNFKHPVVIDSLDQFFKGIDIPTVYRTFLLDSENRIIALGNPVKNPKIKDLYLSVIKGTPVTENDSSSRSDNSIMNVGLINRGDSVDVSFPLFNKEQEAFTLQEIVPSCDCITVIVDTMTLTSNQVNLLEVRFKSDSIGSSFRKHLDIFYKEKDNPERLVVYGYLK